MQPGDAGSDAEALAAMVTGDDAVALSTRAGLTLDGWQEALLRQSLEVDGDHWRHFEVACICPRQNGKGSFLEARELAGLYLDDECDLIVHSAHEFSTSLEAFRRLLALIEDTPDLRRQVKRVSRSHGEEGIELEDCSRIRFKTRTKAGGRGLSSDLLILDEAMILPEHALAALLPTLSARPNPQVLYTGSAVDQAIHEHGVVLARVRERGQAGSADLAYREYACETPLEALLSDPALLDDRERWAEANPALGTRIAAGHVAHERASLSDRSFAVERLGAGDWPRTDDASALISRDAWAALLDRFSTAQDPVCLALDVAPDRSRSAIGVAGARMDDDKTHIEVIDHRPGTGWVVARLAELVERHEPTAIVLDAHGPAGALLPELEDLGVTLHTVTAAEHAQACGRFFDAVTQGTLRHLGTAELGAAVAGVATRRLGDAWAWGRQSSATDISPLVAVTLAAWGASVLKPVVELEPLWG